MNQYVALLRLTRPVNLLIIALTMVCLRWYILVPLAANAGIGMKPVLSLFHFALACLVIMLVAAAGNVLNDYFDVAVDKINNPSRVIVGKVVKRRVALITHIALNAAGLFLSIVLAWYYRNWGIIVVPGLVSVLLWLYSPVFKRQPAAGNVVVALCVAAIPLWLGMLEIPAMRLRYSDMLVHQDLFGLMWWWLLGFAAFAFVLTLAREAQKDMEDLTGDKAANYHTLPIVKGNTWTKRYINVWLMCCALGLVGALFIIQQFYPAMRWMIWPAAAVLVLWPLIMSMAATRSAHEASHFRKASRWNKLAMTGGVLFSIAVRYWVLAG